MNDKDSTPSTLVPPQPEQTPTAPGEPDTIVRMRTIDADSSRARVLVVDDEAPMRRTLARLLMGRGFDVLTAEDGDVAMSLLRSSRVDVMLVDLLMPKMGGMEVLKQVKREQPDIEVIMMTGFGDVETAVSAVKNGAYDFLTKPFQSNDAVVLAVAKASERRRLIDKTRELEQRLQHHEKFGEMVGNSTCMRRVYELALGVAPATSSVLLLGESGTGKELMARAIHQHSPRAGRRFVAVNCSAIPVDLVESELFGHVRGAFTGAMVARAGLFESADGGTLFLDEVGDLSLAAQVKLLRALQDGEIKRVGSDDIKLVDVRLIAATNVDLKNRVTEGRFRQDLFYRLNVIAIQLPALRKRKDDIPLLAYHFMHKYATRMGRDMKRISAEALRLLRDQPWTGNVRELENALEHAVVLARGDVILPGDLPFARDAGGGMSEYPPPSSGKDGPHLTFELTDLPFTEAKKRAVQAFEAAYVEAMLRRTGGNVSEAARQAGLDRSNFRRVLKKNPSDREP